jgi:hypothetical protein
MNLKVATNGINVFPYGKVQHKRTSKRKLINSHKITEANVRIFQLSSSSW